MPLRPGEIYLAYLEEIEPGQEVRHHRVVVVSREEFNRGGYVVVVPITSSRLETRQHLRNCVSFRAGQFGFEKDCVAQAEAITIREQLDLDLDTGVIDTLDGESMRNVIRAIGYVISADCEPVEPVQFPH